MANFLRFITLCIGSVFVASAHAMDYYDVEVIVYANQQTDSGEEYWPDVQTYPDLQDAHRVGDSDALQPLDKSDYQLMGVEHALSRSRLYRPLLHFAWRQPGWERSEAMPVRITLPFGTNLPVYPGTMPRVDLMPPARATMSDGFSLQTETIQPQHEMLLLEGTLKVSLSRYLHLDVDLLYNERLTQPIEPGNDGANGGVVYQAIRMQQSRRMRSDELHYLDNPRLGVIARITTVEMPEEAPSEQAPETGATETAAPDSPAGTDQP